MPTPLTSLTQKTTDWRRNAAREIAELLTGVITHNKGEDAAHGCFSGARDVDIAAIIKKNEPQGGFRTGPVTSGLSTGDDEPAPEPEVIMPNLSPAVPQLPTREDQRLANQIAKALKNNPSRVAGMAIQLGKPEVEILTAIRAAKSGLEVGRGGWIQEVIEDLNI